jgi:hypothetical protein
MEKSLIDSIIIKHLREECEHYNDIWRFSIYGDIDDPTDDFEIDINFVERNYCATSPKCTRYFCLNCEHNLKKIHYYLDNLEALALNWNATYKDALEPVLEIQSKSEFQTKNPDVVIDFFTKIKVCNSYFNEDLTKYVEELQDYDVIDLGWHFSHSLEPLLKLPNLKGIICGYFFNNDLNVLEPMKSLKFIQVRYSFNQKLSKSIYDITFRE